MRPFHSKCGLANVKCKSKNHAHRQAAIETLEMRCLLSAGTLDPSFGTGGTVATPLDPIAAYAPGAATQPDGKTVVVGSAGNYSLGSYHGFLVARYNTNGALDTSFGPSGTGSEVLHFGADNEPLYASAVAVQPDGKIVVAGSVQPTSFTGNDYIFVVRLLPDGSFDDSFAGSGHVILHYLTISAGFNPLSETTPGDANAVAIQKDGKIIVAGEKYHGIFNIDDADFFAARLNSNGTLDTSFNNSGEIDVDFGNSDEEAQAIAIDYNGTAATNSDYGRIVLAGYTASSITNSNFAVVRLNTNGTLDSSFAGDGHLVTGVPGHHEARGSGVVIQANGEVVVGGTAGGNYNSLDHNFILARFASNGALDKSFGTAGTGFVDTDLGGNDIATSLISGYSQKLILGGTSDGNFALAAYTPNGVLDTDFNGTGFTRTAFTGQAAGISVLVPGPNRTIVAVGGAGGPDVDLARYFDLGPKVIIASLDSVAQESGEVPARFFVFRDTSLPFPTRVYFNVGGSALPGTDYTGVTLQPNVFTPFPTSLLPTAAVHAISISGVGRPGQLLTGYVDIPANQQFATVTITPIDHHTPSANKTATFSLLSNSLYDVTTPSAVTLSIVGDAGSPTTLQDTADAYVQDGASANTNFGTASTLLVKTAAGTGFNRETYLKFNLSGISSLNAVQLQLNGFIAPASATGVLAQVFSVADTTWSETGITWNNKPAAGAASLASATIQSTTAQNYTFDVTAYAKAQLAAGHTTISFVLIDPLDTNSAISFSSREAGANTPELLIT